MAEASVFERIVAGEAQYVIRGRVFLHLGEHAAEIVRIEERFASGIGCERRKRLLGRGIAVEIVENRAAIVRGLAVQTGILRLTARRERFQPANVKRINRDVGLYRCSGCSAQSGLIVDTRLTDSVAEV